MSNTPTLALPFVMPAQAQKHVTVNESLLALDGLVQLRIDGLAHVVPPAVPEDGAFYGVGLGASDGFAGQDGHLARWLDGGWQFSTPQTGLIALDLSTTRLVVWHDDEWQPPALLHQQELGIGTTPDAVNRFAVSSPASLFSHAGSDHRMVLNKSTPADTTSLMFQSGWSGRAEMGLAGSDSWSLKLSADGGSWLTALSADPVTGHVGIGTASASCPLEVAGPMRSGQSSSAARPSASTCGAGACLYDSDLNQPIWSDGSQWRDASGTLV